MIIYYDETEISEDMFILMGRQSDKRNFYIPIQQHDKEVRKQVCDEIRKFAYDTYKEFGVFDETDLEHILDQIEKGERNE